MSNTGATNGNCYADKIWHKHLTHEVPPAILMSAVAVDQGKFTSVTELNPSGI